MVAEAVPCQLCLSEVGEVDALTTDQARDHLARSPQLFDGVQSVVVTSRQVEAQVSPRHRLRSPVLVDREQ